MQNKLHIFLTYYKDYQIYNLSQSIKCKSHFYFIKLIFFIE